ncbi:hypothetical protein LJC19_04680 [Oxalobacter sp. OttesenSCG-928-P03]|nr:hypothetical protein [Oxalobacter sp. OttesenSCG-928-P03]
MSWMDSMDWLAMINYAAVAVILVSVIVQVFSTCIEDSWIGKVIISLVAVACLGTLCTTYHIQDKPDFAEAMFNGTVAIYILYNIIFYTFLKPKYDAQEKGEVKS